VNASIVVARDAAQAGVDQPGQRDDPVNLHAPLGGRDLGPFVTTGHP